jgi:hypothetical protein
MQDGEKLVEEAERRAREAKEREPSATSWGLFTVVLPPGPEEPRAGFFLWFESEQELLGYLEYHAVYWACPEQQDAAGSIRRATAAHVKEYLRHGAAREDVLFRLNGIFIRGGTELAWMGRFSELLAGMGELPRRTRLYCRRMLADMEERDVDPLSEGPLEERHLAAFTASLGDFGLEGEGLGDLPGLTAS